jgi:hypothetical protein
MVWVLRWVPGKCPVSRIAGAGPAGPTRRPRRDYASSSGPSACSAAGTTPSSGTRCWPQPLSMAGPNRTCLMRSPAGRPATSGCTHWSRRSPTSAPPPAGRASRCARHARIWLSALATSAITTSSGRSRSANYALRSALSRCSGGSSAASAPAMPHVIANQACGRPAVSGPVLADATYLNAATCECVCRLACQAGSGASGCGWTAEWTRWRYRSNLDISSVVNGNRDSRSASRT